MHVCMHEYGVGGAQSSLLVVYGVGQKLIGDMGTARLVLRTGTFDVSGGKSPLAGPSIGVQLCQGCLPASVISIFAIPTTP